MFTKQITDFQILIEADNTVWNYAVSFNIIVKT